MTEAISTNRWFAVTTLYAEATRLRMFCFPYAGGSPVMFRGWSDSLPPGVDVCPIQFPGRGSRLLEPPPTQMMSLVDATARALLPYLDRPFVFFGHSLGALIGFELAQLLHRLHGLRPAHLFVAGCRAPQLPDQKPHTYNLPEEEFIEAVRRLNGTPREVLEHPELLELLMPSLRADFELVQLYAYQPQPPLGCPITVFGGLQDSGISYRSLQAWAEQTTASSTVRMLPGDHFFVNTHRDLLLRALAEELNSILGGPDS